MRCESTRAQALLNQIVERDEQKARPSGVRCVRIEDSSTEQRKSALSNMCRYAASFWVQYQEDNEMKKVGYSFTEKV